MPRFAFVSLCLLSIVSLSVAETAESLKSYNVDIHQTSVSGISSGANFAVQMQVAHSSIIKGAGIVAGGPFDCGGESLILFCMSMASPFSSPGITKTHEWSGTKIDDVSNMKHQRVYIISGKLDVVVTTPVVDQLYSYYVTKGNFIDKANVVYNKELMSGHTFPTDFSSVGDNLCTTSLSPFISNCGFDGAGAILQHIYGDFSHRTMNPTGHWIKFKQTEFAPSVHAIGLADEGFAYVPNSCANGTKCRLHIAFHGCQQSYSNVGTKFLMNTGYDKWADNNNLIVLFPQTRIDVLFHFTPTNAMVSNFNACWDWVGFYDLHDFSNKNGQQIKAIKGMIDRIVGLSKH